MSKYSTKKKEETVDSDMDVHERAIRKADELRQLDEHNPLEQYMKFEQARKNPPKKDFMKVKCFKKKDENGNVYIESRSQQFDGTEKVIHHLPFFVMDLHDAVTSHINACPSNVGPMLLDEGMKVVDIEKKMFKPEKRKDENKMMVILWIVMITIMVGAGAFAIMTFV